MILSQLLDLYPGGVGLYDLRHTPYRVYLSLVTQLLRKGRTVTTPIQLLDRESERGVVFEMDAPVLRQYFGGGFCVDFLSFSGDVYEVLSEFGSLGAIPELEGFTLLTTGWAAPMNEDGEPEGAPSQHAHRRRVSLTVAVTPGGATGHRLVFADDPDNPITELDDAPRGALAEKVSEVGAVVFGGRA